MTPEFAILMLLVNATPVLETFSAPGYRETICGVRFGPGEASSALPLGALGTGFVEFTSRAAFGSCTCANSWLHPQPPGPQSGLILAVGDKEVRLLPEEASCPQSLRFWGHFPAADVDFGDTFGEFSVHLRAFAPLVPHEYELANLPVALFHFTLSNRSEIPVPVRLALQWQPGQDIGGEKAEGASGQPSESGPHDQPLRAEPIASIEAGIRLEVPGGTFAVGVEPAPGWLVEHQSLEGSVICTSAQRTLAPGETRNLVLGLAWHFPTWMSSDGERLRHRYATRYRGAGEALAAGLAQARAIEEKIIRWQELIYGSEAPDLLKDALINGLYILARNSWWLDDGRFFQSESFTGCPITETFVCRFNGSFPLAVLFPECERATLRAVAAAQAESGEIPFGFGTPLGSRSPMYHLQHPIVSSEFVLTTWRNYALWRDEAYLKEMYPAVKRALRFAMTLDKDGDGLINEDPGSEAGFPANQYYDVWPWFGTSAYTGSIWLAALQAGVACARTQRDEAFQSELKQWVERGAKAFEEKLWTGSYYRLYNDPERDRRSDTSLTNALCGQWFAYASGLGEIVPGEHIQSVIDTVLRLNDAATPFGAVNGLRPDGTIDETFPDHSAVITIGEVWNFCAMAAFAGRKEEAVRLFTESYENVLLRQKTPWNITWSLDRTSGALKWGWNYYSNTCLWTLLQVLDPACYSMLARGS